MRANVLIQTAFLGDLLLSIPLIKRLKKLWPEHKLILVCRRGVGEFFLKTSLVDEVLEVKKGDSQSYHNALTSLRSQELDKVFSTHGSLRTALFVRGLKAQEKIGYKTWWNGFIYSHRVVKNLKLPEAIRQLSLLQGFDEELKKQVYQVSLQPKAYQTDVDGKLPAPPDWASMSLQSFYQTQSGAAQTTLQRLGISIEEVNNSVALFPGSVWATKRWTKDGFIALGTRLIGQGRQVLVMGGPGEEALCAEITAQINEPMTEQRAEPVTNAKDLCAKTTIFESALVLSQVAAVVGNDSASLHLAATCETPSVVMFGPTVLEFGFRPWQPTVFVAELPDLECRPCGKHGPQVCPLGTHACMKGITKEHVALRLEQALKR